MLLVSASASIQAMPIDISSGQSHPDPIWTITAGGSGAAQVITNPIINPWVNPPAGSAWVSTTTANSLPATSYSLSTTVTTAGPSVLTFRALADNELRVYINGALTPVFTFIGLVAADFNTLPAAQTVNLAAGANTIRLDVVNTGSFSGVLFSGTVSDVPEPSTFAALGIGAVVLGCLRRRKSRQSA
jgi:hypothetical protein